MPWEWASWFTIRKLFWDHLQLSTPFSLYKNNKYIRSFWIKTADLNYYFTKNRTQEWRIKTKTYWQSKIKEIYVNTLWNYISKTIYRYLEIFWFTIWYCLVIIHWSPQPKEWKSAICKKTNKQNFTNTIKKWQT